MKRKIFLFLAACYAAVLSAGAVNYTADNTTIFPNPERGFLTQLTRHGSAATYNAVKGKESYLVNHANKDKGTLILVLYYLDEFNNDATLPEAVFTAFEEDMAVLRNYGMKAIFRIAYAEYDNGESGNARSAHDAPLSIIESHLAQYKQHWADNADVIFTFQAGFVGQYGEWYYTDNFGNHVPTINDTCRALLDTALKAIPQNRTLLLRRPMFKQEYLDGVALTEDEAYTGSPKARLGHFNDAFLYNDDNMGTYSSNATKRATQKTLIAQETLYVPLGGETDITDATQAQNQASHDSTVAEMSTMHWTFIKSGYSETVTNMWRENGTFDELNRNMGYRFQLAKATLPTETQPGADIAVNIKLVNVGYAPLYNERHAYLVLKNETDSFAYPLAADPRTWKPNGDTAVINEVISLANDMPTGDYQLYLNLPDEYTSLAHDPRYSVRFANTGVWEETSGMNNLCSALHVFVNTAAPACKTDSVVLPAALDTANVTGYSNDMTMQNGDYFDFGPTDAVNKSRWVEWKVYLKYPGEYSITEETYSANGHRYALLLMKGEEIIARDSTASCHQTGYMTIKQAANWDLSAIPAGVYTLRVKNVMEWGRPKLKRLTLEYDGLLPDDAVQLPATLNKDNHYAVSDEKWYETDYFNFGDDWGVDDSDGHNLNRWIDWAVDLKYPGKYIISEIGYCANGHSYLLELKDGESTVASFTAVDTHHWGEGDQSYTQAEKWNLSEVAEGLYILRVHNATEYGRPKLKSLTLEYDGDIPSSIDETTEAAADGQQYDILGRPVDDSYRGIVIMKGKKILR